MIVSDDLAAGVAEISVCESAGTPGSLWAGKRAAKADSSIAEQRTIWQIKTIAIITEHFLNLGIGFKRIRFSSIGAQVQVIEMAIGAFIAERGRLVNRHLLPYIGIYEDFLSFLIGTDKPGLNTGDWTGV